MRQDLKTLKRSELQKLAKQHGVKANIKTGEIIAALQEILQQNKENKKSEENLLPENDRSSSIIASPTDSEKDLMLVKPPWDDNDFSSLDITPDQTNADARHSRLSTQDQNRSQNEKRSRSSSRNRTPKAAGATVAKSDGKTFSVERTKTQARTEAKQGTRNNQKAAKRRSTVAENAVQNKKMRRSRSANRKSEQVETVDENLKNEIMEEIRKKIAESDEKNPKKLSGDNSFASRIPRFTASGVTVGTSKPITPGNKDWNKLHNKRFNQLESIDDYEKRKKERAERLLGSNKKNAKAISKLAQPSRRGGPKIVKPVVRKGRPLPTFASPAPGARDASKTPRSIMKGNNTDKKSSALQKTPKVVNTSVFKPTITSTSKMKLNFAQKSAKAATPKRVTIVSDQGDKKMTYVKTPATGIRNKSVLGTPREKRKSMAGTPRTLNSSVNNASTPGGTKRVFDLKASLKKPLTWVPHKGPLQPYNDTAKKPSFQDRMKNIKNPNVTSRDKRKQKMAAEKKQAKDKRMMLRRGIK